MCRNKILNDIIYDIIKNYYDFIPGNSYIYVNIFPEIATNLHYNFMVDVCSEINKELSKKFNVVEARIKDENK